MRLQIPGGSPVRRRDCWSTPCFTGGYPWDGKGYPLGQTIAFSVRHVETEEQSFYLSDRAEEREKIAYRIIPPTIRKIGNITSQ